MLCPGAWRVQHGLVPGGLSCLILQGVLCGSAFLHLPSRVAACEFSAPLFVRNDCTSPGSVLRLLPALCGRAEDFCDEVAPVEEAVLPTHPGQDPAAQHIRTPVSSPLCVEKHQPASRRPVSGGLFSTLSHSAVSGGTCIPLGQALVLLMLLWHCQGLILQVGGGRRQRL